MLENTLRGNSLLHIEHDDSGILFTSNCPLFRSLTNHIKHNGVPQNECYALSLSLCLCVGKFRPSYAESRVVVALHIRARPTTYALYVMMKAVRACVAHQTYRKTKERKKTSNTFNINVWCTHVQYSSSHLLFVYCVVCCVYGEWCSWKASKSWWIRQSRVVYANLGQDKEPLSSARHSNSTHLWHQRARACTLSPLRVRRRPSSCSWSLWPRQQTNAKIAPWIVKAYLSCAVCAQHAM